MIPNLPLLIGFSAQRAAIQAYPRSSIANQHQPLAKLDTWVSRHATQNLPKNCAWY
jgi:hypothetical protein